MKNMFKSFVVASLILASQVCFGSGIIATNLTVPRTNLMLIVPNKLAQLQILAGINPVTIKLYDNNVLGNTNITSAYTTLTNYVTNVVSIYISPLTGTTNFQTNSMQVTLPLSVAAATNILPFRTFFAQPSTLATYPLNILNVKGIVVENDTNCSVAITYRLND